MTLTDAAKVIGVVMTSSPGPMPRVTRAVCSAAVQELSASAPGAATYAANSVSNRRVLGPVVIQSERSVSTTSSISSCPTRGGAKGRNVARRRRAAAGVGGGAGAVTAIPPEARFSGKALMVCPRPTVATRVERGDDQGERGDRVVALVLRHESRERAHRVLVIAQCRHGERGGRQHQLHRLGNGHEVALHFGVGDGEGSARRELLVEQREDAAVRAQDVAEAHDAEIGARVPVHRQLEDDALRHPFRGTEDARRVHGLVGRDEDEPSDAVARGATRRAERSHHIVPHAFQYVGLEHRHVLVGGGVEHVVRPARLEDLLEPIRVGNARERGDDVGGGASLAHLAGDEVQRALRPLEQHDAAGTEAGDLTGQLGADRAAGARDEDAAAAELSLHGPEVELDGVTPQQVVDLHLAQMAQGQRTARQEILQRRQDLALDARLGAAGDDAPHLLTRGRRDGDRQQLHLQASHQLAQAVRAAHHPHAVQRASVQVGGVVDEPDHVQETPGIVLDLAEQLLARLARSNNEGAPPAGRLAMRMRGLAHPARGEADAAQEEDRDHPVEQGHGPRHALQPAREEQARDEHDRAQTHGGAQVHQVRHPDIAPPAAVGGEALEEQQAGDEQPGKRHRPAVELLGRDGEVEAHGVGREIPQGDEHQVHSQDDRSSVRVEPLHQRLAHDERAFCTMHAHTLDATSVTHSRDQWPGCPLVGSCEARTPHHGSVACGRRAALIRSNHASERQQRRSGAILPAPRYSPCSADRTMSRERSRLPEVASVEGAVLRSSTLPSAEVWSRNGASGETDWQHYFGAVRRRKWTVVAVTCLGTALGLFASRLLHAPYSATALLWFETKDRAAAARDPRSAFEADELLNPSGWIDLVESNAVLEEVVRQRRLYLHTDNPADSSAIATLRLDGTPVPAAYRYTVDRDGRTFTLVNGGRVVQTDSLAEPVGKDLGFSWSPPRGFVAPGHAVDFVLSTPADAARQLMKTLSVSTDVDPALMRAGTDANFLRIQLTGARPAELAATVNAIADRVVVVAADLKRIKLVELGRILDDQRQHALGSLRQAEAALRDFRMRSAGVLRQGAPPVSA